MDRVTSIPRRTRRAALLVVVAYGLSTGSLLLARHGGITAAWWPAAGCGLVALILLPRRLWPALLGALFAAFALANLTAGRDVLVSSALALADVAETWVAAAVLVRLVPTRRLDDIQDVWRLLAAALSGAVVAALGVGATYAVALGDDFWTTASVVLPAHAASAMLLAPLAMISWRRATVPRLEVVVQVLLLAAATAVTFGPDQHLTVGFAPLPLLVWAAVRFDERVVALEQLVFATAVTLLTAAGWGPFNLAGAGGDSSTQLAQLYLLCVVLIGLPLVKAMRERERALARMSASERVFRRNFTESRVPVALVRWDGEHLAFHEVNPATSELLGLRAEEIADEPVSRFLVVSDLLHVLFDTPKPDLTGWSGHIGVVDQPRVRLDGILSLLEQGEDRAYFSLHLVDVTEPLELAESLEAERNYTRAVIDTASSMIVVTNLDGTVIAANNATAQLTGYSEAELSGRQFWELLIPESLRPTVSDQFSSPRTVPRQGESTVLTKGGAHRTVVFSNSVHQAGPDAPVHLVLTATDVTDARESAGMVSHVLRSVTSIAFIGTDLDGRITLFNTGAEKMLGLSAEQARDRRIVEFLAPVDATDEQRVSFASLIAREGSEVAPGTRDWTMLPEGRSPLKVSMSSNPVTTSYGKVFAYLFVARDVTDTRRSQEILVNALRREREVVSRLKDLDRAKDDFVSTVSHELRTPMSSIIGSAEMLSDGILGDLEPGQQRMLEVIARNGDRLLGLADDLLVLATFDHEAWPAQATQVDLRQVVRESADAVEAVLASRTLELSYDLPVDLVPVRGEASHLERAVTNLLTNAVKFTPDGGRVFVRLEVDRAGRHAVLSVADTGYGIPESDLDQVFSKFFRSAEVQERAIQGSGLGLAIVKTIVESHDGHVAVRSATGEGTTFTITLPLAPRPGNSDRSPGK